MKVERDPMDVLSNMEVLSWLRESRVNRLGELRVRQHRVSGGHLSAADMMSPSPMVGGGVAAENVLLAQNQSVLYLERTAAFSQEELQLAQMLKGLELYDLAPAEVQMILNLRPTKPAHLMPIIEDCLNRFTTAQMEEITALSADTLPSGPELNVVEEDEYGEDEEDEATGAEVELQDVTVEVQMDVKEEEFLQPKYNGEADDPIGGLVFDNNTKKYPSAERDNDSD